MRSSVFFLSLGVRKVRGVLIAGHTWKACEPNDRRTLKHHHHDNRRSTDRRSIDPSIILSTPPFRGPPYHQRRSPIDDRQRCDPRSCSLTVVAPPTPCEYGHPPVSKARLRERPRHLARTIRLLGGDGRGMRHGPCD